jgi:hypothetical protein
MEYITLENIAESKGKIKSARDYCEYWNQINRKEVMQKENQELIGK